MESKGDLQRLVVSTKIPLAAIQKAKSFEVLTRSIEPIHEDILPFTPLIGLLGPLPPHLSPASTPQDSETRPMLQSLVYCSLSGGHQVPISDLFPASDCVCQYCLPCLQSLISPSTCPVCQRCFSSIEQAFISK